MRGGCFDTEFLASFSFPTVQDTSVISCLVLQFSGVVESSMNKQQN